MLAAEVRTTLNMDDSYFSSTFIDHGSWILLISPWTKARNTKALCYERESKLASVTWEQCWLYNSKPVSGEATEQPAAAEADQATQPWRGEGGPMVVTRWGGAEDSGAGH